jgi:surfactin synthase thioesterase subunit
MPWRRLLPSAVEVLPARLPGREGRFEEEPITAFPRLLSLLAVEVERFLDAPFALFGHSLGALVAFELARLLRQRGSPAPVALLVAGRAAPHLPFPSPLYQLPAKQFLAAIQERYGAFDDEIQRDEDLLARFEPVLRADFTLFDTYRYVEGEPLDCPITVFGGSRDPRTPEPALRAWERHTANEFTWRLFPGGHFFFEKDELVLRDLLDEVSRRLAGPPGSTVRTPPRPVPAK